MDGSLAALFASLLMGQQPGGLQMGPQGPAGLPGAGATPPSQGLPNAATMQPGPAPAVPQVPGGGNATGVPQRGANLQGMQPPSQWQRPLQQQFQK
jgi:hypothetical protein